MKSVTAGLWWLQEARPLVRDVGGQGGSFEKLLREWVSRDGHLTGTSARIMSSVRPVVICCVLAGAKMGMSGKLYSSLRIIHGSDLVAVST